MKMTTTYTSKCRTALRKVLVLLVMMVMGGGMAWADTWDGTTKTAPNMSTNNGSSEALAIQITKAAELAWLGDQMKAGNTANGKTYGGKYWKLAADIDLGGNADFTGKDWASMIGNDTKAFCGYFDGGGHTVSNIQVKSATSAKYYGLFPSVQGASATNVSTVKNLKIDGAFFKATASMANTTRIGALAGYVKQATVSDIDISNVKFVYTGGITAENDLGGAIGCTEATVSIESVSVSTVNADFTGTTTNLYVAGLVGKINSLTTVSKCSTSDVTITYNTIANASRISGLIGYTKGAANAPITIKGCSVTNTKVDLKAGINNASYIGAFVAQTADNTQIGDGTAANKNTVTSPDINIGGDIKVASYIGGAVGDFAGGASNTSYISGPFTVTSPSMTVNKNSVANSYIGATFGRIREYSNVRNVTVNSPALLYKNTGNPSFDTFLGTFAGNITGISVQETVVSDIKVTGNSQLTIGTSGNISKIRAGILGQATTNAHLEDWQVESSAVTANGDLATSGSYLGGFAGYLASATGAPLILKNVKITGNCNVNVTGDVKTTSYLGGFAGSIGQGSVTYSTISIDGAGVNGTATVSVGGNVTAASYAGGFVGRLLGKADAGNSVLVDNVKVGTTDLTIEGQTTAASYYGGLAGQATTACTLNSWSITTASKLAFNGNITALSFVGGAIGSLDGAAGYPSSATGFEVKGLDIDFDCDITTKGIYVGGIAGQLNAVAQTNRIEKSSASGKIHTTGSHNYTNGDLPYTFGGIVGYMPQNTTTFSEVNNCISEVDFALSGLTPATSGNLYSGFVVGGVIGRINTPSRLPESLYYAGKIYAPSAAVAPIVGVFVTKVNDAKYLYDDYTGVNATAITEEWMKADDWYYNGFKIGLSSDVRTQTLNTTESPLVGTDGVSYLTIGENTLTAYNSINGETKPSKTVLAYTAISPAWNTNKATYPAYYMYYMQGVNRGKYLEDAKVEETKKAILTGAMTLLTLKDSNADFTIAANRGVISHALKATATGADSYRWYVDGVAQTETTANFAFTPTMKGNTIAVEAIKNGKAIKRVECKVYSVFRVGDASAETGTRTNPYLIGSANELQLLSYLSTLPLNTPWEKTYTSDNHYNKAYYKLDKDIDLSGVGDFTPISFATGYVANNAFSIGYVFDGVFDGQQHKISGLKEEWYGGAINSKDAYLGWGLFSVVGNPYETVKVGDSQASPAAIRNLIIDDATLTHRTSNTTFNYNEIDAVDKFNNVGIGVLAGVVQNNTKIENIEIRNAKITDEGSGDYSLATGGLYVGGAVGTIQNAFNEVATAPVNTKLQHVAAQVDITLEHPTFADATVAGQACVFNIGGIIGRYCATSALQDQAQASMPAYTLYSGNIVATKAWISPVLGALRYTSQQAFNWATNDKPTQATQSKQWEGNNGTAATQLSIENAQYYNFKINNTLITELYPSSKCEMGARSMVEHFDMQDRADNGSYNAAKYQGVNYNARFIDSEGTTLYFLNQNSVDGIYWVWENGFPHMTDQNPNDSYLTRAVNEFTANLEEGTGSSYRWLVSYDGETWTEVDGLTQQTSSIPASARRKLVVAIITVGGTEYRTQAELVDAEELQFAPYIRQTGDDASGYVLTIVWNGEEPSGILSATYQWYHSDKTAMFDGETGTTLNLTKAQLDAETDGLIWCGVTILEMGEEVVTIFVKNTANVVYVNGNNYAKNGAKPGVDTNDGRTPQTPVKTIDKANSLLDGGPWEKNIIVVMGKLSTQFTSRGLNPAYLTGFWDGIDYEGIIGLSAPSDGTVNPGDGPGKTALHNYVSADTKFENLIFHSEDAKANNMFLECHSHDVWLGKGIRIENFNGLSDNHGNLVEDKQVTPEFSIILTSTNPAHPDDAYWTRTKPQTLTIESGHYGRILGGRYISNFFDGGTISGNTSHSILATANHPIWAVINIDIDKDNDMNSADGKITYTCDINCVIAGLTDGTVYGDYIINMNGGNVRYIVGANQGNGVISGTKEFTIGNKKGKFGQWPNSSFFGRTIINVEHKDDDSKPILLNNLYAGGLGRNADKTGAVVDMYVYGHTEINLKSGTVLGNVYGGGAGGVIGINPWDPRLPYKTTAADNAANAIINGVQYGGMPEGSSLVDVVVHQIDEDGNFTSETEILKLTDTSTTVNISGGTIGTIDGNGKLKEGTGNVFGGGNGFVSNMKVEDKITMQGVGSVFGTTHVNITGGEIMGSVYGGSQGDKKYLGMTNVYGQTIDHIAEMNGTVNLSISGTDLLYPTIGGNIYGAGMGISSEGDQEYLDIARAGNSSLGDQYKTDIHILIDLPESHPFTGNIYGGGQMGAVDGTTEVVIKGGSFEGDIFGGGKGEDGHPDKAKVTGSTSVIVDSTWGETTPEPEPAPSPEP